ncbi:MAG: tape measure protein [Bacteroidales bacterium]|nr:tape measure protein [Bacteroidales bacterium]
MSDIIKHSIDVTPIGLEKLSQVPAIINKVSDAASKVQPPLDPLNKIVQILSRIEKILMAIGRVGVESFNKLDDILVTNRDHFKKATDKATELEAKIEKIGDTSKKAGKSVKEGFLENFNKVGAAIRSVQSVASVAAGILSPIFEEGMARQNAVSDFETLIGKDDAKDYADKLRKSDAAKLYGASTINENAKSMLAYGLDKDTVMEMQNVLGDIAMGDKNKMTSLATAFSQMSSLGKLQTQDWKQMVGAGFNPFTQMQKDLGKTAEELDTMMSKGQITADMVKNAFVNATKEGGQFAGSMESTIEGTLGGKMAVMKSSFDDLKAKLFELALPIAEKILPLITDHVFPLVEKLLPLVEKFTPVFEGIIAVLSMLADWIAANSEEVFTLAAGIGAIAAAVSIATSPVTLIVVALGALIYALVNVLKYWDEWGKYVVLICPPLALVMNLIQSIKRHWDSIVDGFTNGGILEGIKRIGLTILDAVLAPVENLLEMLAKIPGLGGIADWVRGGVSALREKINNALPEPKAEPYDRSKDPMVKEVDATLGTQAELETAVKPKTGNPAAALQTATAKGAESVASGGTRNTQITINLGNMVETVNFNGTPADNAQETVDTFTSQLLRVLYSAQTAV